MVPSRSRPDIRLLSIAPAVDVRLSLDLRSGEKSVNRYSSFRVDGILNERRASMLLNWRRLRCVFSDGVRDGVMLLAIHLSSGAVDISAEATHLALSEGLL